MELGFVNKNSVFTTIEIFEWEDIPLSSQQSRPLNTMSSHCLDTFMHMSELYAYVRIRAGTQPTRRNLQVKIGTTNEITQNIYCLLP